MSIHPLIILAFMLFPSLSNGVAREYQNPKPELASEPGAPHVPKPANLSNPESTTSNFSLSEDLSIGVKSGDENYMFSEVSRVAVDFEGTIYIQDEKEGCIKIFDQHGTFIKSFGKKGQGPGEIQSYGRMSLSEDSLAIMDVSNARLTFFSKDGEFTRHVPIGKYRSPSAIVDSKGFIYGDILSVEDTPVIQLIQFNRDFEPISTITTIEMPKQPPPGILMERLYFRVRDDDSLVWGRTHKYEIHILNADGEPVKRIVKEFQPIEVTTGSLRAVMQEKYPDRPVPKDFVIPNHFPKIFPIFDYFICDDEGRIYVHHFMDKGENHIYDVFDSSGAQCAVLSHTKAEGLAFIRNGKAYFTSNDGEFPELVRYKIQWD
jgi:hypothetical protein